MDADEYESLPTTSISINMAAGAIAGVLEHCVMYPLDSVKTRMQSMSPVTAGYTIYKTFKNMITNEGILRPIRGVTAVVAGAGPAHALYFGTYEMSKEVLTKFTTLNNVNYLLSGALATMIHDAISNPTDVIKQRMQMYNSPYKSVIACMLGVYKAEGITAFYRSYSTQLMMNIPNATIHFATYEFFQNFLNSERKYNPPVHVMAGGAAGACAAAVTTPLDVVKTLLNTQETGLTKSMSEAVKQIYSVAGPRGFFRGIAARVLYAMPATAICWSTYEFFKFYFCGMDRDQYKSSVSGKNLLQPKNSSLLLPIDPSIISSSDYKERTKTAYVLPNATASISTIKETQQLPTTTTTSSPPSSPSSPPSTASIKTVCELSSNVSGPTLNLHTRHTAVKGPFDRGFSSP